MIRKDQTGFQRMHWLQCERSKDLLVILDFSFSCCGLSIVIAPVPISKAASLLSVTFARTNPRRATDSQSWSNRYRRKIDRFCDLQTELVIIKITELVSSNQRINFVLKKEYRTVASSVKIRSCIFEIERVTKKRERGNTECARVRTEVKKIIGGRRNPDRSCIERHDARYHYVAAARSLIRDSENGEIWIRLNDQWEIDRKDGPEETELFLTRIVINGFA